jgi:hypothetical protein
MSIWITPTTAPHSLNCSSTVLSSTAAMMQPQQSTPLIDSCATMGIWPVGSSRACSAPCERDESLAPEAASGLIDSPP